MSFLRNFFRGFASIELFPTTKPPEPPEFMQRSDRDAIAEDWAVVGQDLYAAIEQYEAEHAADDGADDEEMRAVDES